MAMKRCPVCGERYSDTYKNCPFCEEEEYWEEEQETRRPLLREGGRASSRSRSPYSIVTPVLIVLIVLMAALLVYLLYGDKIAEKFSGDSGDGKPGIQEPKDPQPSITALDPVPGTPGEADGGAEDPNGGEMPEGSGGAGGTPSGNDASGGSGESGGMSYAAAAALPGGLTLSTTDFTEPASTGTVKLRVSGGSGTYTWISENPAIATVAGDGTVTLVAKGTTNVVVTDGSKKAICIVRVSSGPAPSSGGGAPASPTSPATTAPSTSSGGTPSSGGSSSGGGSLKAGKATVVNGGNGVRVRSGPGTNYDILATVPNGGSVQIVRASGTGDWYEITFTASGGVTTSGYMKGEFLSNS